MDIRSGDKIAFFDFREKMRIAEVLEQDTNVVRLIDPDRTGTDLTLNMSEVLGVVVGQAKIKEFLTKMRNQEDSGIFSVEFIKRTNGEYRKMQCQYNVRKHLAGGTKSFDDKEYDLKTVYSHDAKDYRCIALEGIVRLACNGRVYLAEEMLKEYDKELNKQ